MGKQSKNNSINLHCHTIEATYLCIQQRLNALASSSSAAVHAAEYITSSGGRGGVGVVSMVTGSYKISKSPNQTELGPNTTLSREQGETGEMWGGTARAQPHFFLFLVAVTVEDSLGLCFSRQLGFTLRLVQRGIPGRLGVLAVSVMAGNSRLSNP